MLHFFELFRSDLIFFYYTGLECFLKSVTPKRFNGTYTVDLVGFYYVRNTIKLQSKYRDLCFHLWFLGTPLASIEAEHSQQFYFKLLQELRQLHL